MPRTFPLLPNHKYKTRGGHVVLLEKDDTSHFLGGDNGVLYDPSDWEHGHIAIQITNAEDLVSMVDQLES